MNDLEQEIEQDCRQTVRLDKDCPECGAMAAIGMPHYPDCPMLEARKVKP